MRYFVSFFPGDHPAPSEQVAVRERLHLHHVVQARPAQRGQHREGEAVPILVRTQYKKFLNCVASPFVSEHGTRTD